MPPEPEPENPSLSLPPMSDHPTKAAVWTAYGLLVLAMLVYSSNIVVARYAVQDIPPLALTFWRWVFVLVVLAPFVTGEIIRQRAYIVRHWKMLFLLAGLSTALFNALFFVAMETTTAVNGALLAGLMPITIVLGAWAILRERISRFMVLGVALSFVGMVVVVIRGDLAVLETLSFTRGDLLILIAIACYSGYSVLLKRRPEGLTPNTFIAVMVVIGIPPLLPFYLWEIASGRTFEWNVESFSIMFYSGIVVWLLANVVWVRAIAVVGASVAAQFHYLMPIFGSILAVLLLGEDFLLHHFIGLVLILAGIYLAIGLRRDEAEGSPAAEAAQPTAESGKS